MSARAFELRGGHVLVGIVLFFSLIVAINVAFAVAAVQTFPGEDVRRSYAQGLRYNDVLAERQAQTEIGWRARSYLTKTIGGTDLVVNLHDHAGAPLGHAVIEGVLRWPPRASGDRALKFTSQGQGVYVAELGDLPAGRWDLRGRAHDASGKALDFEAELTWPSTP